MTADTISEVPTAGHMNIKTAAISVKPGAPPDTC